MRYVITRATASHLPALPDVELQAAALFVGQAVPQHIVTESTELPELHHAMSAGYLWVALDPSGQPVGFALAAPLTDALHLEELAVAPAHGRRGLGQALVAAVCSCARTEGRAAVTLTTFRDLPWNAPFYQRLGFTIIPREELSPTLAAIVQAEAQRGLPPELRVVMKKNLALL